MTRALLLAFLFTGLYTAAQDIKKTLSNAVSKLETDEQFRHSIISFYVEDSRTGAVIYKKNEHAGLAPASCQKIITSASAFELLGKNFRYSTGIYYDGDLQDGFLKGDIYIKGSGDPTFGSWRFADTKEQTILASIATGFKSTGIKQLTGSVYADLRGWENVIPDGWIWQDIGNYYGAPSYGLNWRENQYDLKLNFGNNIGDTIGILEVFPVLHDIKFNSELLAAVNGGRGSNAYIYLPLNSNVASVRGAVGLSEKNVTISGAMPLPANQLCKTVLLMLKRSKQQRDNVLSFQKPLPLNAKRFVEFTSPAFDSMNYWFMKKSINLYGEAFVKTIAYNFKKYGSTNGGIELIQQFWQKAGIDKASLNIVDGSGLSPANRITAFSLVKILSYASRQDWFAPFHDAFPVLNNIRMKDGYISGVRSYSGYVKSRAGKEYTFAFIVNNFDGDASSVREKIWKILDLLK